MIECPTIGGKKGYMTLIDMGTSYEALEKDYIVSQVMDYSNKGERLKHIFLTHPDIDHYNIGQFGKDEGLLQKLVQKKRKVEIHIGQEKYWYEKDFGTETSRRLIDYIKENREFLKLVSHTEKTSPRILICGENSEK